MRQGGVGEGEGHGGPAEGGDGGTPKGEALLGGGVIVAVLRRSLEREDKGERGKGSDGEGRRQIMRGKAAHRRELLRPSLAGGRNGKRSRAMTMLFMRSPRDSPGEWRRPDKMSFFSEAPVDVLLLLKALVLGVVEGLTEFLPISSTGHLILAGDLLDFNDARGKLFVIVIQSGAILAVVWEYRARIAGVVRGLGRERLANRFALNLLIAFLPLAILGLAFKKTIEEYLFQPLPVALAFIVGAFVILWAERRKHAVRIVSVEAMSPLDALKLGLAQAVALIPGASRSGATIIGGLLFGLSRRAATEFSFFLAIPTLIVATIYKLYKERALLDAGDAGMWAAGVAAAFVSAFLCVRWLLRFVSTHDFTPFAWYRIAFGIVVLVTWHFGWVEWSAS